MASHWIWVSALPKTSCMVGNFFSLVLLLASPVFSLGGGLIPKILSMVGNLVLSVLREEEPVPKAPVLMLLLFESDIGKPRIIEKTIENDNNEMERKWAIITLRKGCLFMRADVINITYRSKESRPVEINILDLLLTANVS